MKIFSDITSYLSISNRKPIMGRVHSNVSRWWDKKTRSSRIRVKIVLWLDSDHKNDRVIISSEVVLNSEKTAPEQNVDMDLQILHYVYDPIQRCMVESHPEESKCIDGQLRGNGGESMYVSLCEPITAMKLYVRGPITGIKGYLRY
ncbi:hypothetical protein [Xenorhabdus sp. KJ12.1]|uniref:hypothetical protein n=1 Tax=Xenorhabdus sp. KJ12.1 TaxID=1851571 RepID=UPI000C047420|nr:hypothetical protein [Xenorhabdus sp. KJ12.1]PHM72302.1 hypothetical protein Xekj_00580 [Xenorhabdus sp. KJ12.1]